MLSERRIQALASRTGIDHPAVLQVHLDLGEGEADPVTVNVGLGLAVELPVLLVGSYAEQPADGCGR